MFIVTYVYVYIVS